MTWSDLHDLRSFARQSLPFALALLIGAASASPAQDTSLLAHSRQIVVVTTPDWDSVHGTLQRYARRGTNAAWKKIGEPIAVVVGKSGTGWGDGLIAVPAHAPGDPVKHEGDGKSPAGVFRVGTVFGYAAQKPDAWAMPYRPLTPATECVDDRASQHYNRIVERTDFPPDWKSSEHMRSEGEYYQWGAVIEQNPENRPGDGSCVFLHVSDDSGKGTTGCTAMSKPELETVLEWFRPDDNPLLVEMPMAEYRQAAKALHLPQH